MYNIQKFTKEEVKQILPAAYNNFTLCGYQLSKDSKVLGQVVSYLNPYIGKDTLILGAYKMTNNIEAAKILLTRAVLEAKQNGYKETLGPMNGSTWEAYRFGKASAEKPFFGEPELNNYYIDQWKAIGFKEDLSYYSSITEIQASDNWEQQSLKMESIFSQKNIRLESMDTEMSDEEWKQLSTFNNNSFAKNPLFSPISNTLFKEKYSALLNHIDKAFIYLAKQGDKLVGLILAYPDLANLNDQKLVLKTMARLPGSEYKGLGIWLASKLHSEAFKKGYTKVIHALMHCENASTIRSNEFKGKIFRNYKLFKLKLS